MSSANDWRMSSPNLIQFSRTTLRSYTHHKCAFSRRL